MNNIYSYKFTVFTATFNRGSLLVNVYESLKSQSFQDFEWLIVDDGSTDNTENLVSVWLEEKIIPIRYIKQLNQGKHVAINLGVQKAAGELFLMIDSDDYFVDNALEKFISYWEKIPAGKRISFSGIMANCVDQQGLLIGTKFPKDIFDESFINTFYRFNIKGDKCGFFKTEILKEYPFPVIDKEKFLSEALVWNRISLKFKTRFINEELLIVDYQKDGLSGSSLKLRVKYPFGAVLYYKEFVSLPVGILWKIRNLINYLRFSFHSKKNIFEQILILDNLFFKLISIILLPVVYFIYRADIVKIKN